MANFTLKPLYPRGEESQSSPDQEFEWMDLGYLITLFELQGPFSVECYERKVTFGEFERTVEEAVIANFKLLPRNLKGA
jgi:hypothetical protein